MPTFSRKLGDSELSYFLPSRADGVNDMYLHLGFRAPRSLVNPYRVALAWAILRLRHPLLAASVLMEPGEYDAARFVYTSPTSAASVLLEAQSTLLLKNAPKDVLIDNYLNGPRTLSSERVSVLILSSSHSSFVHELEVSDGGTGVGTGVLTPPPTPRHTIAEFDPTSTRLDNIDEICEFDILFCAAHFLGDGIALHTCVNDLFMLLAAPLRPHPNGSSSSGDAGPNSNAGRSACVNAEASAFGDTMRLSDPALHTLLELEWSKRWKCDGSHLPFPDAASSNVECTLPLPPPLESRLPGSYTSCAFPPSPLSTFQRVAHDLAFKRAQGRLIGGHAFARVRPSSHSESDPDIFFPTPATPAPIASSEIPRRQCHTLIRTVAFPPALTRRVLKRCKEEGVSVAHVLFALCNVAWGRVGGLENSPGAGWRMPMMMYSALNLRPYLTPSPAPSPSLSPGDASYWFLAVGYFNVVLPAFLLPQNERDDVACETSARRTLFHRARLSKRQCASAAKTPFLAPYAQRMAQERGERARRFAQEDDRLDDLNRPPKTLDGPTLEPPQGLSSPPTTPVGTRASTPPPSTATVNDAPNLHEKIHESLCENLPINNKAQTDALPESPPSKETASPRPSSTALLGLSLLGNLDAMYTHSAYAPLTLHTLTTGSRQRAGALLLFGYTFGGRLWVSLGWDGRSFGGEGEGARGETRGGVVWEGLGDEGAVGDKSGQENRDKYESRVGVGCEGDVGRWWREVVKGVGEFFGEESA